MEETAAKLEELIQNVSNLAEVPEVLELLAYGFFSYPDALLIKGELLLSQTATTRPCNKPKVIKHRSP